MYKTESKPQSATFTSRKQNNTLQRKTFTLPHVQTLTYTRGNTARPAIGRISAARNQDACILQCFTKNGIPYNTLGSYYSSLYNSKRKSFLDLLIRITSREYLDSVDISGCQNWNQIVEKIMGLMEQPRVLRGLFDYYKDRLYFDRHHILQLNVLDGDPFKPHFEKLKNRLAPLKEHEQMERPEVSETGEIDPNDIQPVFTAGKSCVITALFQAEGQRIKAEFGADSVEAFHNVLVTAFNRSRYTDDPTAKEHQILNTWKNYSDDSVYPSLYLYFGYTAHREDAYTGKWLGTVIGDGELPPKEGMISLPGHMIYFNNTGDNPRFYDNDSGAEAPSRENRRKNILCIYYKD